MTMTLILLLLDLAADHEDDAGSDNVAADHKRGC
jgi:hypothetical protein